jgi:hypothetical protein
LSKSECERQLAAISSRAIPEERERVLNHEDTEIRFVAGTELRRKLDRLRELYSHKHPNMPYAELFEALADLALKKLDPTESMQSANAELAQSETKSVSRPVKRFVFRRDRGQCTYVEHTSGRRCTSRSFLELDHIVPPIKGGSNDPNNLRVRCRAHNQLAALHLYGQAKMAQYIPRLS